MTHSDRYWDNMLRSRFAGQVTNLNRQDIIIFAAIITPKRVWGCHPCSRPVPPSGIRICFFKLDSKLIKQGIMPDGKFSN
ncbi:hypothetical protein AMJ80_09645 [bacterium SM23_31]|nr:MAG: hypothetical protein AMJ80_09645 [bacterium SM23_31]